MQNAASCQLSKFYDMAHRLNNPLQVFLLKRQFFIGRCNSRELRE